MKVIWGMGFLALCSLFLIGLALNGLRVGRRALESGVLSQTAIRSTRWQAGILIAAGACGLGFSGWVLVMMLVRWLKS